MAGVVWEVPAGDVKFRPGFYYFKNSYSDTVHVSSVMHVKNRCHFCNRGLDPQSEGTPACDKCGARFYCGEPSRVSWSLW